MRKLNVLPTLLCAVLLFASSACTTQATQDYFGTAQFLISGNGADNGDPQGPSNDGDVGSGNDTPPSDDGVDPSPPPPSNDDDDTKKNAGDPSNDRSQDSEVDPDGDSSDDDDSSDGSGIGDSDGNDDDSSNGNDDDSSDGNNDDSSDGNDDDSSDGENPEVCHSDKITVICHVACSGKDGKVKILPNKAAAAHLRHHEKKGKRDYILACESDKDFSRYSHGDTCDRDPGQFE